MFRKSVEWAGGDAQQQAGGLRRGDIASDLLLPLGQSVVTGALLGLLAVVGLVTLFPSLDPDLLGVWGGVAVVGAASSWLALLKDTRALLWGLEKVTGIDLDGDGEAGAPVERIVVVNASRAKEDGKQAARRIDADRRRSAFAMFVGRLDTVGTSWRKHQGRLSREDYTEFRDTLLRLGWARWNSVRPSGKPNERKGWALVLPVAEILDRVQD